MTRYMLIDAPGHHGDTIKVYSTHSTAEAAKRAKGRSTLFSVAVNDSGKAKGDTFSRSAQVQYVR